MTGREIKTIDEIIALMHEVYILVGPSLYVDEIDKIVKAVNNKAITPLEGYSKAFEIRAKLRSCGEA